MASSPPLFLLLLLLLLVAGVSSAPASERTALLLLRSSVNGRTRQWNTSEDHCRWRGVKCDGNVNGSVIRLALPGNGLAGIIPSGVFGNLTSLVYISLRQNSLASPLPADLSLCRNLSQLRLSNNKFTGPFPSAVLSLTSLSVLDLSGNAFSGAIPAGLGGLSGLSALYLDRNNFSGQLPDLALPALSTFNVSSNPLNGSVPAGLRSFPASSFLGTSLCGGTAPFSCPGEGGDGLSGGAIAGIVIACVVVLLVAIAAVWWCLKKRKKAAVDPEVVVAPVVTERKPEVGENRKKELVFFGTEGKFGLEELLKASAEVLGKGTFGTTYKASLESGPVVAVKRLKESLISEAEFRQTAAAVAAMRHENVVELKGYYFSKDEKLLVYAYNSMGSLSSILHGNKGSGREPLIWSARLNIALTAARGIAFIHSKDPKACHGNIKSSNILLTTSYNAIVSDHALIQLATPTSTSHSAAYSAPELTEPRQATHKSDVYSFGILLLELLTGKEPAHVIQQGTHLLKEVLKYPRDEWSSELFDMELLRFQSSEEQMEELLQLAIDCCSRSPDNRPAMDVVATQIMDIQRPLDPIDLGVDSTDVSPSPPKGNH